MNSWLSQPHVRMITPTQNHWAVFERLLTGGQASGYLTTDAHLAALAITHQCILYSTDLDFSRFRGLQWKNPLKF